MSDGEKAILKSDALSENETAVRIQAYDKGALLRTADGVAEWDDTTLYLKSYTTDDGTTWYPVSVSDGLSLTPEGNDTWSLDYDGGTADSLTVTYSADYPVSDLESELNIPSELQGIVRKMAAILEDNDGAAQKLYEDRTDVNQFFDALNDYGDFIFPGTANEWAIVAIQECMSEDALRLYTWLNPIASAASPVAAYCSSANATSICSDAETLAGALKWLRTDATNWANMLDFAEDYGVTATSVNNLITYLDELADLSNYSISGYLKTDAASNDVALLIAAVQTADTIDSHTESATSITVTREYTVVTPGNATVTVNLVVDDSIVDTVTGVVTFDPSETSKSLAGTSADPDALISELETSFNDGGNTVYLSDSGTKYYKEPNKTGDWDTAEISPDDALTFTKTYSSQSFNVYVESETIAYFETGKGFASYSFTLPYVLDENENPVNGYYYTYASSEVTALDGKSGDVATISRDDLGSFGDDYSLTISRSIHKEETDTYKSFVADVNESLKDAGVSDSIVLLMQIEEDATNSMGAEVVKSIVLRLSPSSSLTVSELMEAATEAFEDVIRDLSYIGIDGEPFYKQNTELNLQVLADLFLKEGNINSTYIIEAINEDGTIANELKKELSSDDISDGNDAYSEDLGGKFVTSDLSIEENGATVDFYVTLASETQKQKDYLQQLRQMVNALKNRGVTFETDEDEEGTPGLTVNFDMTLASGDRTLYKLYLAVLAMTGQVDLSELADENNNEMATLAEQAQELLDAGLKDVLASEDLTAQTLQNSLEALGVTSTLDLTQYANVIDPLLKRVRNLVNDEGNLSIDGTTFDNALQGMNSDANSLSFDLIYDTSDLIKNKFKGEVYEALLNELFDTDEDYLVTVPITLEVQTLNTDYEAIVMDMGASGAANKITLATDLKTALADAKGTTLVWLQNDVTGDLEFNTQTILNLNGHTITGDITANAALRIVDTIMTDEVGGVVGEFYGTGTIRIAAGSYTTDVREYCSGAYTQNYVEGVGDKVENQYYTIKKDESGNLELALASDLANVAEENLQMIALEITSDLIFEFYSSASLTISGGGLSEDAEIYEIEIADLVGTYGRDSTIEDIANDLLNGLKYEGTNAVLNDLIAQLSDYSSLADAAMNVSDIVSYTLTTCDYQISSRIVGSGDSAYVTADIEPSDDEQTRTVTIKFAEKSNDLAYMFQNLAKVVTKDEVEVNVSNPVYSVEDGFSLNCDITADVAVDLSNGEDASLYTEILGVLMANMEDDAEEKADLVNYIRLYAGGYDQAYLKEAVDHLTIGELKTMITKIGDSSFAEIVEELGLSGVLTEAVALESYYYTVLKIAGDLTTRMESLLDQSRLAAWYERTLGNTDEGDYVYDGYYSNTLTVGRTVASTDVSLIGNMDVNVALTIFSEEYEAEFELMIAALDALRYGSYAYWYVENDEVKVDGGQLIIDRQSVIRYLAAAQNLYNSWSEEIQGLFKTYYEVYSAAYKALLNAFTNTETEDGSGLGLWVEDIAPVVYTGSAQKPTVVVHDGLDTLVQGRDYNVSYANNINATRTQEPIDSMTQSTASANYARVVITFTGKSNFKGTIYQYFIINPIDLDMVDETCIEVSDDELDSVAITPYQDGSTYYFDDDDHTTTYAEYYGLTISDVYSAYTAGTYGKPTIKVNGKTMSASLFDFSCSEYSATKELRYANASAGKGTAYTIHIKAKPQSGVQNFVSQSETTATQYSGILISKVSLSNRKSSYSWDIANGELLYEILSGKSEDYTGYALKLNYGKDPLYYDENYTIDKINIEAPGTYTITLRGVEEVASTNGAEVWTLTNRYIGTRTIFIKVTGTALKAAWFSIVKSSTAYTGDAITLTYGKDYTAVNAVTGEALVEGEDYSVTYKNNTKKGTATVSFKGLGKYTGTINKTFKITAVNMSDVTVSGSLTGLTATYTKGGVTTGLTDQLALVYNNKVLTLGTDYTVSFRNNGKVRTDAQYRIVGKGNFTGNLGWQYFEITAGSLNDLKDSGTVTVSDKLYNKNANNNYMPASVVIKDSNGKTLAAGTDYYAITNISDGATTYALSESNVKYDNDSNLKTLSAYLVNQRKITLSDTDFDENGGFGMQITIVGRNNYAGSTLTVDYNIYQRSLSSASVVIQNTGSWDYGVTKYVPEITVRYKVNGEWVTLTRSVYDEDTETWSDGDYRLEWDTNENLLYQLAGVHTATITGVGQYGGTRKVVYTVQRVTAIQSVLNGKEATYQLLLSYYTALKNSN